MINKPNLFASFLKTKFLLFNILGDINKTFPLFCFSFLKLANSDKSSAQLLTLFKVLVKCPQICLESVNKFIFFPPIKAS